MTRQRRWQIKKNAQGLCSMCGKPIATGVRCLKHAIAQRESVRVRLGCKSRYDSLTYRLEKLEA